MAKATRPWAAGASVTRSTARRPSICSCRTRRPTSQGFPTSRSSSSPTSPRPASAARSLRGSRSATPWSSSRRGPSDCAPPPGAKLSGASLIIAVDGDRNRLEMARTMGADVTLDYREADVVAEVKKLTGGGADAAIEALGTQETFESALRSLRPGGTLSSLGVYSGKVQIPYEAFAAGLGDYRIVTTLCPGGKERMRRLMEVVRHGRVDLTPLLTHTFPLDRIGEAYDLFGERLDGVMKVAIRPSGGRSRERKK